MLRKLCRQKAVEMIEGHAAPDHIHMLLWTAKKCRRFYQEASRLEEDGVAVFDWGLERGDHSILREGRSARVDRDKNGKD